MKAAVLHKVHAPMTIEDFELPTITADEVLIKVKACGVCHTDYKVIEGRIQSRMPAIVGHEVSGTIEEVGISQRAAFKTGDAVIVGTRYRCGHCQYCVSGRENLCRARPAPASLRRTDGKEIYRWNVGGFSQYLALPGYMVFKLPEGLSLDEASVVGCRMTTAYNAVKNSAEIKPGDSALVIGCGGVGLNTIQFLRLFGAYPIIAVDVFDTKLEAARKFGATHTIDGSKDDPVKAVRDLTDGGVNKAFEALGNVRTADQIIQATRPGGTATIIGGLGKVPFTISDGSFTMQEIKIAGVALRRPTDVIEVLHMVRDKRIDVAGLISRRYRFDEINDAFHDLEAGKNLMGITVWN
ncbi:MAG TPA: alcohol dehydrogenase catalytic domain-containing protein [Terriglobales bacterium]|jgi:Zn-dependent alcohol dehydrogenase|nr:alcohol dehydrogenase catalytic domain-containing protein [Terriglobales bacterium]